jgi:hypothetical protein
MRNVWGAVLVGPMLASASVAQEGPPAPEPRAPSVEPEAAAGGPQPRPEALAGDGRPGPGWTLRAVPDGSTVALAGGPGRAASLAVFCLGGAPWLAIELAPPPEADAVRAGFAFSGERVEVEALREEGAGGAYVVELAGGPLAGLLAGTDAQALLAIDGTQQGALSLAGSSAAIREALAGCSER